MKGGGSRPEGRGGRPHWRGAGAGQGGGGYDSLKGVRGRFHYGV